MIKNTNILKESIEYRVKKEKKDKKK